MKRLLLILVALAVLLVACATVTSTPDYEPRSTSEFQDAFQEPDPYPTYEADETTESYEALELSKLFDSFDIGMQPLHRALINSPFYINFIVIETISDIENLRNISHVETLALNFQFSGLEVIDLAVLEDFENLELLYLSGMIYPFPIIYDISILHALPNLTELSIRLFNITYDDLTIIGSLTNLTGLNFNANQINDITPLANLTNLTSLSLSGNVLYDLTPLTNLTNLIALDLGRTQISDITALENLHNLTALDLVGNLIEDISPLSGLYNLIWLNIGSTQFHEPNPVTDIAPLKELTNLRYVFLGGGFNRHYHHAGLNRYLMFNDDQMDELIAALPNCNFDSFPQWVPIWIAR